MYLVECYNDETVLRVLGVPKRGIRRMRGKGNVLNLLKRDAAGPHTGIVDRDGRSPNPVPITPFRMVAQRDGLALHTWQHHRLVVVEDRIEDWIMTIMALAGTDLSMYQLPVKDAGDLHRLEMNVMDPRLVRALENATAHSPAPVRTMREFLGIP